MKKLFFIVTLLSLTGFAQTVQPQAPANLGATMKSMAASLKKITAQAADATKNAESEQLVLELVATTKLSKNFIPPTLKNLPADQQKVQLEQYNKLIDESVAIMEELAAAFHDNNNTKATDLITKINAAKKEGHNQFK